MDDLIRRQAAIDADALYGGGYGMLTREEALRKHRQMWTAMQEKLGDTPRPFARFRFKAEWCEAHGDADVDAHCYLCQYVKERGLGCADCPIDWDGQESCSDGDTSYKSSPISKILALPEREVKNE